MWQDQGMMMVIFHGSVICHGTIMVRTWTVMVRSWQDRGSTKVRLTQDQGTTATYESL